MSGHLQHSGRGGSGNTEERRSRPNPEDIAAELPGTEDFPPELHGPYSTGRGGAANVKKNDMGSHVARIAQDLSGSDRHGDDHRLLDTTQYSGRGGVGNIRASRSKSRSREQTPKSGARTPTEAQSSDHHEGLAEKLKHALLSK